MSARHLDELARRAVACKRWRWMPGMLTADGVRVIGLYATGKMAGYTPNSNRFYFVDGSIPDLTDPATLGCLLALVREAWGQGVYLLPDGGWYVKGARLQDGSTIGLGICATSEAEALVAALEAAQ